MKELRTLLKLFLKVVGGLILLLTAFSVLYVVFGPTPEERAAAKAAEAAEVERLADVCQQKRLLTIEAFPAARFPETEFKVTECGGRITLRTPAFADEPTCHGVVYRAVKSFSKAGFDHWSFPSCYSWRPVKGLTGDDRVQYLGGARYNPTNDLIEDIEL